MGTWRKKEEQLLNRDTGSNLEFGSAQLVAEFGPPCLIASKRQREHYGRICYEPLTAQSRLVPEPLAQSPALGFIIRMP